MGRVPGVSGAREVGLSSFLAGIVLAAAAVDQMVIAP